MRRLGTRLLSLSVQSILSPLPIAITIIIITRVGDGDLNDGPDEAAAAPDEPTHDGEGHDGDEDQTGPVHIQGGDAQQRREGEEDDEKGIRDDGGPVGDEAQEGGHAPGAEAEEPGVRVAAQGEEEDGESVRGVQGEHGEGEQGVEGDGAADVDMRERERKRE